MSIINNGAKEEEKEEEVEETDDKDGEVEEGPDEEEEEAPEQAVYCSVFTVYALALSLRSGQRSATKPHPEADSFE